MVYTFASCNHPFIWAFFLSTALCYTGRMMVQHIQLQPLIATVSVGTGPGKPQMLGQGFCPVPSSFSLLLSAARASTGTASQACPLRKNFCGLLVSIA